MFPERAAEAMEFYVSIFKNSKVISTIPGPDGKPMGGSFELEGQGRFRANVFYQRGAVAIVLRLVPRLAAATALAGHRLRRCARESAPGRC